MIATRALLAGTFGYVPPSGPITLTEPPYGGCTQIIEPRAIYRAGVTYFCFIDGAIGHIWVGTFTHATGAVVTVDVGVAPGPVVVDIHNAPVIQIRPDGRLIVVWSGHNAASMWVRISTNPLDISSWGTATNIDSQLGGTAYTYPSFMWLGTDLYLFYRDRTSLARWCMSVSSDGGETWAAQTVLISQSSHEPYIVVCSDGSRIDMAVSGTADGLGPVYHLYFDGSWKSADGSSLGSPPFSVTELPEVFAAGDGVGWPNAIVPGPAFMYTVDTGSDWDYRIATYAGTWTLETLGQAGQSSIVVVQGTLTDPDTVYGSVLEGSFLELVRWDREGGWPMTHLTEGSSEHNIYAARVHDGVGNRRVLWLYGTFDASEHDVDWAQGIRMWS